MTGDGCQLIHDFVDGNLDEEAHRGFRGHLATCARCQTELHDIMQLSMAMEQVRQQRSSGGGGEIIPIPGPGSPPRRRYRQVLLASAVAACAAAGMAIAVRPPGPPTTARVEAGQSTAELVATFMAQSDRRPIEGRLSSDAFAVHRPLVDPLLGNTDRRRDLPIQLLAELQRRGDWRGVAALYLFSGVREQAEMALHRAAPSPEATPSPELGNDLAVVALSTNEPGAAEKALNLLDGVLARKPGDTRALWNRGLVLRSLGLTLAASESFGNVAARGERGWSDEARVLAATVAERDRRRETSWNKAVKAGEELVTGGPLPSEELVERHPGLLRQYLYHALRAAPSKERVLALLPMAAQIDRGAGGEFVQRAVRRTAALDFARRGRWAEEFRAFFKVRSTMDSAARDRVLARLRGARQPDLLLGALTSYATPGHAAEIQRLVRQYERNDPWFEALAAHELARDEIARDQLLEAEQRVIAALPPCRAANMGLRCGYLEYDLSRINRLLDRPAESRRVALQALQRAGEYGEWGHQIFVLEALAATARHRREFGLSHAYLDEAGLRKVPRCGVDEFLHLQRALLHLEALEPEPARRELAALRPCEGKPIQLAGAELYGELARFGISAEERATGKRLLDERRAAGGLSSGQEALADKAEGLLLIDENPAQARVILERAITRAERLPRWEADAREARAYSFAALVDEAGRGGRWQEGLQLLGRELGVATPARCAVGLSQDLERLAVFVRGADGVDRGSHTMHRARVEGPAAATSFVPPELLATISACPTVDVMARPPLQGHARLPDAFAWRYRAGAQAEEPAATSPPRSLVIANVETAPELELPPLSPWSARDLDPTARQLTGTAATPARALEEMRRATEIVVHAHALVNLDISDVSLLALAPGDDKQYALTARQVRAERFTQHPVVFLAACRAAQPAPSRHRPWSLPIAFIEAGASAVIAAAEPIGDLEARAFVEAVRKERRAGKPLAVALREARQAAMMQDPTSPLRTVVVFQ